MQKAAFTTLLAVNVTPVSSVRPKDPHPARKKEPQCTFLKPESLGNFTVDSFFCILGSWKNKLGAKLPIQL